jgi:FlaA1/EpsC-like NDP-sugar epimerase
LKTLAAGISVSSFIFYVFVQVPMGPDVYPRSILLIDAILVGVLLGGIRLLHRVHVASSTPASEAKRVLIYGAGDAGELIVREMRQNPKSRYKPVGFIDDDPSKKGQRIHGIRVLGGRRELPRIVGAYQPVEILLALPSVDPSVIREVVRALGKLRTPIKTLPRLRDLIDETDKIAQIRNLSIEDLLSRPPVGLDVEAVRTFIEGRRVMVTGAGGSIGSELCRQILQYQPADLVLYERYENNLHAIRLELDRRGSTTRVHPVIGDVTDEAAVQAVLGRYRPQILFHAAAHKHVPLMEENPCEAVKNNVRGTRILVESAEQAGVDRFILISTDKAANAVNVMGATKRVAELIVQGRSAAGLASFSIVRFGNVLGSNGSVVPLFIQQIKEGGPVTVTHPDVRRFFMLIPEAVQLVLHAAAHAHSGATYVLDMGDQIKVVDIATNLIRQAGLRPYDDIAITFTGLRPGETLDEELVGHDERLVPSHMKQVSCVIRPAPPIELAARVRALETAALAADRAAVVEQLRQFFQVHSSGLSLVPHRDSANSPKSADIDADRRRQPRGRQAASKQR